MTSIRLKDLSSSWLAVCTAPDPSNCQKKETIQVFRSTLFGFFLVAAAVSSMVQASVSPTFSAPVGRSAFAFALSEDESQAVVVNLFPRRADDGASARLANSRYRQWDERRHQLSRHRATPAHFVGGRW